VTSVALSDLRKLRGETRKNPSRPVLAGRSRIHPATLSEISTCFLSTRRVCAHRPGMSHDEA